jgi:hypothetical protein
MDGEDAGVYGFTSNEVAIIRASKTEYEWAGKRLQGSFPIRVSHKKPKPPIHVA